MSTISNKLSSFLYKLKCKPYSLRECYYVSVFEENQSDIFDLNDISIV